eukprot:41599-Eustigmatos_ZCMA.PRE.1
MHSTLSCTVLRREPQPRHRYPAPRQPLFPRFTVPPHTPHTRLRQQRRCVWQRRANVGDDALM